MLHLLMVAVLSVLGLAPHAIAQVESVPPESNEVADGLSAAEWSGIREAYQAGLTGLHLRSVLRLASGFHSTRPRGKETAGRPHPSSLVQLPPAHSSLQ